MKLDKKQCCVTGCKAEGVVGPDERGMWCEEHALEYELEIGIRPGEQFTKEQMIHAVFVWLIHNIPRKKLPEWLKRRMRVGDKVLDARLEKEMSKNRMAELAKLPGPPEEMTRAVLRECMKAKFDRLLKTLMRDEAKARRAAKKRNAKVGDVLSISLGLLAKRDLNYGSPVICYACNAPHKAIGLARIQDKSSIYDVPLCGPCCSPDKVDITENIIVRKFCNSFDLKVIDGPAITRHGELTAEQVQALIEKQDTTEH
jgi:hypothetical protein